MTLLDKASNLIIRNTKYFGNDFPTPYSTNGYYGISENKDWTTGFWTGQLWLAYEHTHNEKLKEIADLQVESFLDRIEKKIEVNHHDMGFLYSLSCVSAYKLTKNEHAKKAAIMAADNLILRFQEKGQFLQAWGELGAKDNYRLIIDCLLNVPLLYWASEVTGDDKYENIGKRHVTTAMKYIIRDDHSTYHTFFFDSDTGLPQKGVTHQGYKDDSAWARGQAWGIYGCALSYKKLKDNSYIEIFDNLLEYFISHLPNDLIPYWDLIFTDGSDEPRDSSALAIAICGIFEMSKLVPEKSKYYRELADKLLKALADKCMVNEDTKSNGLLLHGTYCKSSPYNTCPNWGVDECVIWGDYFFMEALTRAEKDWELYW